MQNFECYTCWYTQLPIGFRNCVINNQIVVFGDVTLVTQLDTTVLEDILPPSSGFKSYLDSELEGSMLTV